eukprot:jgi/Tetstr1/436942/TSEL_025714.t1
MPTLPVSRLTAAAWPSLAVRIRNECGTRGAAATPAAGWGRLPAQSFPPVPAKRGICTLEAGVGGTLEPPDLRELARMSQIGITEEEVEEWTPQIGSIVEWFGELGKVDVDGVEPALRALQAGDGTLRADKPVDFADKPALLKQVPDIEGVYVKVPKISTEADS